MNAILKKINFKIIYFFLIIIANVIDKIKLIIIETSSNLLYLFNEN